MRFNIFRKITTNINNKPKNLSEIFDATISVIALSGFMILIFDKN